MHKISFELNGYKLCSLIDPHLVAFCFVYDIYLSVIEICFFYLRILRVSRSFTYMLIREP